MVWLAVSHKYKAVFVSINICSCPLLSVANKQGYRNFIPSKMIVRRDRINMMPERMRMNIYLIVVRLKLLNIIDVFSARTHSHGGEHFLHRA